MSPTVISAEYLRILLSQYFLTFLWQSTLLIGAVWLLDYTVRRIAASIRVRIWTVTLVVLPLLPLFTWLSMQAGTPTAELEVIPVSMTYHRVDTTATPVEEPAGPQSPAQVAASPSATPRVVAFERQAIPLVAWALAALVYTLVAAGFGICILMGRRRLNRLLAAATPLTNEPLLTACRRAADELGIRRRYRLLESDDITVPITAGIDNPVVCFPAGVSAELGNDDLHALALHELGHIRRGDIHRLWLVILYRIAFFFHPLVWFVGSHIRKLTEFACDELVLEKGSPPDVYADVLVRFSRFRTRSPYAHPLSTMLVNNHSLVARVHNILAWRRRRFPLKVSVSIGVFMTLALAIACAVPLGLKRNDHLREVFEEARHAAMFSGNERVHALVDENPEVVVYRDGTGKTLFHIIAGYDVSDLVCLLDSHDADINAVDNAGMTPLHVAVSKGNRNMSTLLAEKGADVEARDAHGRTPLHIALGNGDNDLAKRLMDSGAELDLLSACLLGWEKTAHTILHKQKPDINQADWRGVTPLHAAAMSGNRELTEILLHHGADVDARTLDGETPLHLSAWNGHRRVSGTLVEHGADVNAENNYGITPLTWARQRDEEKLSDMLREHGGRETTVSVLPDASWDMFMNNPYSDRLFLVHMLSCNDAMMHHFDLWTIRNVYRAGRNAGNPLYVVQIGDERDENDTGSLMIFDDGGAYLTTVWNESIGTWLLASDYSFDTESVEIIKKM